MTDSYSKMLNDKCVFVYTISSGLISLCIFLYGYKPLFLSPMNSAGYQDLPTTIDGFSIDPKEVYNSHIQRLVLIVVDSLSMDSFTDETSLQHLPHMSHSINTRDACLIPCYMPPPSTNMQKIKTLATGTTSSFIETILTFSRRELEMDSIFRKAKENKLLLSLHGAETWTQLFPGYFQRAKTVTAPEVFDYSRVDANVTKTLITEIEKDDWNWLLLQYMGLKHLARDPYSESEQYAMKLLNLDDVVKFAHRKLKAQDDEYLILVIGDTGVGYSHESSRSNENPETIAPYIMIGKPCLNSRPTEVMDQYDLAPTLAVLTGLPIPAASYGTLNSAFLYSLTDEQLLYALHYNTARLVNLTSQLNIEYSEDPVRVLFRNAVVQYGRYLRMDAKSYDRSQLLDTTIRLYSRIAESLSKRIHGFLNTSDVSIQYLAFVLVFEAMIICVNQLDHGTSNKRLNFIVLSIMNLLILTWVLATGISKLGTSFIHMTLAKGFVIVSVVVLMLCNSYIMATQRSFLTRLLSPSATMMKNSKEAISTVSSRIEFATSKHDMISSFAVLLVLGTILHAFSLLELSYVKSEKSVWFFMWSSICFFIIYNRFGEPYRSDATSSDQKLASRPHAVEEVISIIFSILIMHRTIMAYTAVEDSLSQDHNQTCASFCLILGLVLLAFTCNIYFEPFASTADRIITQILLGLLCCSIYTVNAARGIVILPYYPKSEGSIEMMLFCVTWTIIMGYGIGFCTMTTCYKGSSSARQLIATAITCWACLVALLTRSHKVLLIPIEMLFGQAMSDVLKNSNQSLIISHVWLGHLFFHYQGYTYGLDSVDTTAGLLFSRNLCSLTYGVLLVMNTFSAPVISYLICVHGILSNNPHKRASQGISETNLTFGYCRLLLMSVYLLGMLVHRHNEWFWSIFCPKLLWEIVYTFVITAAMIAIQMTGSLHDLGIKLRIAVTESMQQLR